MGGPSVSAQQSTATAQTGLAQTSASESAADRQQRIELQQPLISKEQALAAGDSKAALSAAMPQISQISQGYKNAKDSIFSIIPPGASRDAALADLERQKATATGGALSTAVASAPEILANVGSGLGAFSLQELGAGLSGYQGAAQTQKNIADQQTQAKGNTLGFLGSLAGAAGTAAGGGAFGKLSDRRLKSGISALDPELALARALHIPVVRYYFKDNPDRQRIGVIAQDVEEAFPQLVSLGIGHLEVDYGGLAAIALAAAQELAGQVKQLQRQVTELRRAGVLHGQER